MAFFDFALDCPQQADRLIVIGWNFKADIAVTLLPTVKFAISVTGDDACNLDGKFVANIAKSPALLGDS